MKMGSASCCAVNPLFSVGVVVIFIADDFSGVMRNTRTARLKWIREESFGAKTTG
jgi:hypothetical protein